MMGKTITLKKATSIALQLKASHKSLVLVGGCFDILHIGHVKFLKEAKKLGDVVMVLLESDKKVSSLKGKERPLHRQKERAQVLASLLYVDYVVLLPYLDIDLQYDKVIASLRPDIIAVSQNDPIMGKKQKQAKRVGSRIEIIPCIKTFSSSKLVSLLGLE